MIVGSPKTMSAIRLYSALYLGYALTWLGYPFYAITGGKYQAYLIYTIARIAGYDEFAAKILVKQARYETGNFEAPNSVYAKGTHNLFGMQIKNASAKWQSGAYPTTDKRTFAVYPCDGVSVIDRILRDDDFNIPIADGSYIGALAKSGYSPDKDYYANVARMDDGVNPRLAWYAVGVYSVIFIAYFLYFSNKGKRKFSKASRYGRR